MMRPAVAGNRALPTALIVLGVGATWISGCVRPSRPLPQSYCQPWVSFFVAHTPGDDLGMDAQISDELRTRGFDATSGPFEEMPSPADVLVIYEQRWWQNILVRFEVLHLEVRDVRTGVTLAAGSSRGTSVIGHRPATLVEDAVGELLAPGFD